ncbi:MAG: Glycosyltransferase [uncultured Sulfurovum sp.]|uniref:Glycosyltransferase n=1 Tax=uncultured Sulfurovum sp. TaxID=269237 RepID=A0A6S6TWF8_9BACT|nr:MAG: Glycosyltransferase [uncultured Sulfurovum sp.]
MKILLLGEFSSLHKNLKDGLVELGYDVVIASTGDSWKNVPRDIDLKCHRKYIPNKLKSLKLIFKTHKLTGFDVVQLINPFILYYKQYFPNKIYVDYLIKHNKDFFLLAAGDDAYYWKYGPKRLRYTPHNDALKYDKKLKKYYMQTEKAYEYNTFVANHVNGIIPIMYDYEECYRGAKNLKKVIPIPMNMSKIEYTENIVQDKLVVFHGLNRYGFKGTKYVEEAFEILINKYPNDLELIIDGNLPLEEYLLLMAKTNVVIDQTSTYSLGVNGVYALAMGKVVLGGAEEESLHSLGVNSSPVINIEPNAMSIVTAVEKLLNEKENITKLGYESRVFAENTHDHIKVARQYLKTWGIN